MQRFINSFISSNDPNVRSPDVSPERKYHNKQINQFQLNNNAITSSGQKKGPQTSNLLKTMQDTHEIPPNVHESGEANDGDIVVEYVELEDSQFRKSRLSRQDQKASLCDLLRNGQTNQTPSFIKQFSKAKSKELLCSPKRNTLSSSFNQTLIPTSSKKKGEGNTSILDSIEPFNFANVTSLKKGRSTFTVSRLDGENLTESIAQVSSPRNSKPVPIRIQPIQLQIEPNHFSSASSPSKITEVQLEYNTINLEKNQMNTQSQLFKKHLPDKSTRNRKMYGKIQTQQNDDQNLLQNENVPISDVPHHQMSIHSNVIALAEGDSKQRPKAQSPHYAQKRGPGNKSFEQKPIISDYSPEIDQKNQQTTPTKIDLSLARKLQMTNEEDDSNVGVMSSIGLAISQFFTGKAQSEEEELKKQEQEQGDDTHVYANLNDHDEEGNVGSKPSNAMLMSVSNKYTFAEKVEQTNAEPVRQTFGQTLAYKQLESLDSDEDNIDDTNAISYSASFKGNGSIRHINQINTGVSFKRTISEVQMQQQNLTVNTSADQSLGKSKITIGTLEQENLAAHVGELISQNMMDKLLGKASKGNDQANKYLSNAAPQSTQPDEMMTENQSTAMSMQTLNRRTHSKTTYMNAQELAHLKRRWTQKESHSMKLADLKLTDTRFIEQEPEVPLREIDNIVFNQDKSQFAVIWSEGGFTKFEVASLQVLQQVYRTPSPDPLLKDEVSLERMERQSGIRKNYNYPWRRRNIELDEDDKNKADLFKCVALQHKTKDYVAALKSKPCQAIFVSIPNEVVESKSDQSGQHLLLRSPQKSKEQKYGRRTDVRHFSEEINDIQILPGARYTLFSLETKIYVYSRNSKDLFDIIRCVNPTVNTAITKQLDEKAMIAFLEPSGDGETVHIRDYGANAGCTYSIKQPFGWGYKVGGMQLDVGGHRLCLVSSDGCYVYIFGIQEEIIENETIQELEEDEFLSPLSDENPYLLTEHVKKTIEISQPLQKFQRGSSSCKEIYKPIQFVHGFSTKDHHRDFILMSSSSMTTHFFVLSEETDEEKENWAKQHRPSWVTFSRFLPAGLTLERSAIRLNVQEEVSPPQPFRPPNSNQKSPRSQTAPAEPKQYPYVCFVETTGLLVVISMSGYCCKFSIELEDEQPVTDLRTQRYNNKNRMVGSRSPVRHRLSLQTGAFEEPDNPLAKSMTPGVIHSQINQVTINSVVNSSIDELKQSGQLQSGARSSLNQSQQSSYPPKQPGALSGFKQPILRLKFKVNEFFSDKKAESQQRIKKRQLVREKEELRHELIRKYNMEQKLRHLTPAQRCKQRNREVIKLSQLLSQESIKKKPSDPKQNLIHRPF